MRWRGEWMRDVDIVWLNRFYFFVFFLKKKGGRKIR